MFISGNEIRNIQIFSSAQYTQVYHIQNRVEETRTSNIEQSKWEQAGHDNWYVCVTVRWLTLFLKQTFLAFYSFRGQFSAMHMGKYSEWRI